MAHQYGLQQDLLWTLSGGFILLSCLIARRDDLLHPINLMIAAFAFQYLVPAVLLALDWHSPFGERFAVNDAIIAYAPFGMALVIGYMVSFVAGFSTGSRRPWGNADVEWQPRLVWAWSLCLLALQAGLLLLLYRVGALAYSAINNDALKGTGWINYLLYAIDMIGPFYVAGSRSRSLRLLAVALYLATSVFFFVQHARGVGLMSIFWLMLFYYYHGRSKFIFLFPLLLPIGIVLAAAIEIHRLADYGDAIGDVLDHFQWRYLFLNEIGRLEQLAIFLDYSVFYGVFDYGRSLAMTVFGPFAKRLFEFDDYRNAISALVYRMPTAEFASWGFGGSGVADAWMIGGPLATLLMPWGLGFAWSVAYQRVIRCRSAFNVTLYINISIWLLGAVLEMANLSPLWTFGVPFALLTIMTGLGATRDRSRYAETTTAIGPLGDLAR